MTRIVLFFCLLCSFPKIRAQTAPDTLYKGKTSIRGLSIDTEKREIWFSGSNGITGRYNETDHSLIEKRIVFDSIKPDFRSIAQTANAVFVLSTGSPALMYKIDKSSMKATLAYREAAAGIFYDALQFTGEKGMAIGDPVDGCFSILTTADGGSKWKKSECGNAPPALPGEASFAASNSGLILDEGKSWFVSGGGKARIFRSVDFGLHWEPAETSFEQGAESKGIFSLASSGKSMAAAGGDYMHPEIKIHNFALTDDGGKSWWEIATPFGYVSCVQAIPETNGRGWACAAAQGIFTTTDNGQTWKRLSPGIFHTIRIAGGMLYAAGNNILVRFRL